MRLPVTTLLAFFVSIIPAAASMTEPKLFTSDIKPANVEGKVFVFKNLYGQVVDQSGGSLFRRDKIDSSRPGEQFVLFYVGTDQTNSRDYYAIAGLTNGLVVDVAGTKPGRGTSSRLQMYASWVNDWTQDDRVFYFENAPNKQNAWLIKTWYNSDLCWDGWDGAPDLYLENPNGGKNQAWQLWEVDSFQLPSTTKATKNQVVPVTPPWNKVTPPSVSDAYTYQEVGSTILPYFFVLPASEWGGAIQSSPYCMIKRDQRWIYKDHHTNNGKNVFDKSYSMSALWSRTESKTFSAKVGVAITESMSVGAKIEGILDVSATTSVTVSSELSWQWSHSSTYGGQQTVTDTYHVSPCHIMFFWQVAERFRLYKIVDDQPHQIGSWVLKTKHYTNSEVALPKPNACP